MNRTQLNILFFLVVISKNLFAQINYEKEMKKQFIIEQSIENIAENSEEEDIDFTTLFDQLSYYYEHPININKKNIEFDLKELKLLTQFQIHSIINHRKNHGNFVTIYELQTVPLISSNDLRKIKPFITLNKNFDASRLTLQEIIKRGKNELFIRQSRVLNQLNGQNDISDSTWLASPNNFQLGSQDNIYFRYRFKYQNYLSIGVTAEKDAGEAFLINHRAHKLFNTSNKFGFDYYSAHFFIRNIGQIKAFAIGDYHIQLGQGLTFWSGLAIGKSSNVMGIKRNATGIKPYTSLDENQFLRGSAIQLNKKKFSLLLFGSKKNIDANLTDDSTLNDGTLVFSSFQRSGIHSTISELENKDAIEEIIIGSEASYKNEFMKIGLINSITRYNGELNRNISLYNQFQLNSPTNWANGIHYSVIKRNFNIFGESSISSNGGTAHLHGLLASLHPRLALSILYRNYEKNYQSTYSNALAENSTPSNESGLLNGLVIKINNQWEASTYFDQFKFPWMKFQVNQPKSYGLDGFFQLEYHPSKTLNIYGRIRHRIKSTNEESLNAREIKNTVNIYRWNYRLNFNVLITESIRLRNRIEYNIYKKSEINQENGILIIQDIMYKPKESKFSFSARFAIFDTDSYNTRIYSYENDVLYYFRIPAYYYQGTRTYLNIKYQISQGVDFWIRGSSWNYNNRNTIGSGYNKIENNNKIDLRAQLRIKF